MRGVVLNGATGLDDFKPLHVVNRLGGFGNRPLHGIFHACLRGTSQLNLFENLVVHNTIPLCSSHLFFFNFACYTSWCML